MIERIREAIRPEGLDGWLFHNFRHRDPLSDGILGLDPKAVSTRRWFYALPLEGEPLKLVHSIERGILDSLPGQTLVYASQEELRALLSARLSGAWAAHYSENLPVISYLDAGTRDFLSSCGISCRGADVAIQRLRGLLDAGGEASHREAASALYRIVEDCWRGIRSVFSSGSRLAEGRIRDWILSAMAARGLETDHPPIVAAGASSGDPHYDFADSGRMLKRGDVIQLDLWARKTVPGSIWADISWVGIYDNAVPPSLGRRAEIVFAARDRALAFLEGRLSSEDAVRGLDVDAAVRAFLAEKGCADALRHRTGHGIDTECHGSGVNLDSVEFPDARFILEGSCFSVEPGIYFAEYGLRTEINVLVRGMRPIVTGGEPQTSLLSCGGE